jgi:tetratricopeptide (TPR) repeat protein
MMQADSMLIYAQEALKINQAYFGEGSRECAFNLNMIAMAYDMKGDKQAALEIFNEVIDIFRVADGDLSLYVALTYNNMAGVYVDMGNYNMGIDADKKAWDILVQITDEGSIHRANVASNLAVYFRDAGNLSVALDWVEHSITELECGKSNMSILQLCYKLKAELLISLGRYEDALMSCDKGLDCWNNPANELKITITKASLLERFGYMLEALNSYKSLLSKYDLARPEDVEFPVEIRRDIDGYINQIYIKILQSCIYDTEQMSNIRNEYNLFLEDKIYLYIVTSSDGPAAKAGLSGVNYLLRLNEWDVDSILDLYQYSSTLAGKEKHVVLYTPDGVREVTFENRMGAQIYMDRIPREWKPQIINEYRNWLQDK